jgi:lysophospholipase L1-like esterase
MLGILDRPRDHRGPIRSRHELRTVELVPSVGDLHAVEEIGVVLRGCVAVRDRDLEELEAAMLEPRIGTSMLHDHPRRGRAVGVDQLPARPALVVVEDLPQALSVALLGLAALRPNLLGHRDELVAEARIGGHAWKDTSPVSSLISPTVRARFVRRYRPSRSVKLDQTDPYREWWQAQNERALSAPGPLWIALGDSIAQGIGASAPDQGYVGQLLARLQHADGRPWRVLNLSVSGARVGDVRRTQVPALREYVGDAELVTCGVGVNDLIQPGFRHVPARVRALTRELPSHSVVATVPHGFSFWRTVALNTVIRREVQATALGIADVWHRTRRPYDGKLSIDHFHPSDAGHADWCAAFVEALGLPPT